MNPTSNIELKARLHNFAAARETAGRLATKYLGVQEQIDTYFHCPQGRMKLREIVEFPPDGSGKLTSVDSAPRRQSQLIWYERPDETDFKQSDYRLTEITDPNRIRQLKTEMGIHVVVEKRREIFLHNNVRIHLDEVSHLGTFIEFEAVLGPGINAAAGRRQLAALQEEFGIAECDLIANSYADLLREIVSI